MRLNARRGVARRGRLYLLRGVRESRHDVALFRLSAATALVQIVAVACAGNLNRSYELEVVLLAGLDNARGVGCVLADGHFRAVRVVACRNVFYGKVGKLLTADSAHYAAYLGCADELAGVFD